MGLKILIKSTMLKLPFSRIFMFHHVTNNMEFRKSNCIISEGFFKKVILANKNYDSIYNVIKKRLRRKIAITFDDGLIDVYSIAYYFLKEQNIPFTIFVVPAFLDKEGYITTEQLIELSRDPLVTIGAHGMTHCILKNQTIEEQEKEILDSKTEIEKIISKKIDLFAYSHGQYDKNTIKIVSKNFKYAFTAGGIVLDYFISRNKYAFPRIGIDEKN